MARSALAVVLCSVVLLSSQASAANVQTKGDAVGKVLELMSDIMAKAKHEKQEEKERFAAFSEFCKVTIVEKTKAIEKGASDIEAAQADIAEADAAADALAEEVAKHSADIDSWSAEKAKAKDLREEQHKIFQKMHAEAVDSIESTISAEHTLEEGNQGVAQAALLQLAAKTNVPPAARRLLMSFTQDPATALLEDKLDLMGTPQAAAYEGSSGKLIEVVHNVEDKLKAEKKELEEREGRSLNAYNLQVASLDGSVKKATMESEFKAAAKAEQEQAKAAASGALADATSNKKEDEAYLSDLKSECTMKTKDFHRRQEMRKGEIEAITKAMEIMSSDEVAGGAQHTSLAQKKAHKTAMAQLRSSGTAAQKPSQRIASKFLAEKAEKMNSRMLSLLATHASADPFGKVVKMIKDMIQRLMEQQNDEADHKAFCDAEMGTNKVTRETKSTLVTEIQAKIEELTAHVNKLAQKIVQTESSMAEIDAAMAKATEQRQAEKKTAQATLADSKAAAGATQRAIEVLKEYYEAAGNQVELPEAEGPIKYDPRSLAILSKSSGGAFVQQKQRVPGAPEMESGQYTGADSSGVIGMLEIFASDLASVISVTEEGESKSVREFEAFSTESAKDKAVKATELKHQQDTKTAKESDLQAAKVDLKSAEQELQAATDYFEKLKPSCVEVAVSYEDRVAARNEEVESLQEALTILSDDA